ncbi:MAG: DUF4126 domain-containing protein [Mucilaginibacter polytrichastri]|nr:DUF4126 domain-containing protein [Mucilaginibacter polytrichastri]
MKTHQIFWKAVGMGAIAGARSLAAPALLIEHYLKHPSGKLGASRLSFMQRPAPALLTRTLMFTEFAGDKLPTAPNRISPSALTGRALSGMLVGATVYLASGKKGAQGAIIGATSAVASTLLTFFGRKLLTKKTCCPDVVLGLAEDVLTVKGGQRLLRQG